jgi:hypothetical protein
MKINKTIYNLDNIILLEYNDIVLQLHEMSDIRIDILLQMLKIDKRSNEYIDFHNQLIYLDKNISIFLKCLRLKEGKLVFNTYANNINVQISLN